MSAAPGSGGNATAAAPAVSARSAFSVYESAAAADARALVTNIDTYLPLAFFYRDEERISLYMRRIVQTCGMAAAGAVDATVKARWIRLLLDRLLDQAEALTMHVQIKMFDKYAHRRTQALTRRGGSRRLTAARPGHCEHRGTQPGRFVRAARRARPPPLALHSIFRLARIHTLIQPL